MNQLDKALIKYPRQYFLPSDLADKADIDTPIPIGYGQTNSQPSTVKMMLSWLDVQESQKVLDLGSGSGWTTALLSYLVGAKGSVCAVEKIPELLNFGRQNCNCLNIKNVKFYKTKKDFGLKQFSPFDRILVSASADKLPTELTQQLSIGGIMVIPVKNDILEIHKVSKNNTETQVHPGFVFVPLVK